MKTESPPTVFYKGQEYETGNERHGEIELYLNRQFIRTVDIKDLDKKPMGRMFRRDMPDTTAELRWIESGRVGLASNGQGGFIMPLVIRRSLNTTGRAFRYRELEWEWVRVFGPSMTGVSFIGREDHLAKPVTKKDILDGYLRAGHYFNNFKPRV